MVILFVLIYQMQGLGSKGQVYDAEDEDVKTTFDDVAGLDEEKQEMIEIVNFLKNPDEFYKMGAKIPRGVLLCGQPGTGKTLIAKAIAGEAEVPFISMSGSEFIEMFAGLGASRVRKLFEKSKENVTCNNIYRRNRCHRSKKNRCIWCRNRKQPNIKPITSRNGWI